MRTGAVNVTVMKEKIFILHFQLGKEGPSGSRFYCILKTGSFELKKEKVDCRRDSLGLSIGLEIIFWTVFGHWM